jgi:methylated-DNA-[protein]-cysteine S-methyltransferase
MQFKTSVPILYTIIESPVGRILIVEDSSGVFDIRFIGKEEHSFDPFWQFSKELPSGADRQLREYFNGDRFDFDFPMALKGTPFQLAVWNALKGIPYGETVSYLEIARRIGHPDAVRAVGAANGANPLPIVLPCHRVIGSNGKLTGYGGGIEKKKYLLSMETLYRGGS